LNGHLKILLLRYLKLFLCMRMINLTKKSSVFFITLAMAVSVTLADDADTLAVKPVTTVDTLAAAPVSAADSAAAPAPDAVLGVEPAPPAPPISYIGAGLSFVIPGAGQIYHKSYILGVGFLTAEVITGVVSLNRWDNWIERLDKSYQLRDTGWNYAAEYRNDSIAMRYYALADRAEYEARQTKYTAYNAFAWTVGIYYYNFMDALERGGVTARGKVKDPTAAGLLAAVPFFGLGQFYNGHPGKAGMMSMTQAALAATAINHHRLMEHAYGKYNEIRDPEVEIANRDEHLAYWKSRYDQAFSRRNTYLWISLFAYLYGIFDAVVDAHLSDYTERIRVGPDLSIGADGGGASLQMTVGF
jgi:TM2 domain-containing membrane protein YozV